MHKGESRSLCSSYKCRLTQSLASTGYTLKISVGQIFFFLEKKKKSSSLESRGGLVGEVTWKIPATCVTRNDRTATTLHIKYTT